MNRRSNDVTAQSAAVLSWLRQREDEMAALLADLVTIPTENPPVNAWDRLLRESREFS
jgi:hypothetical protein